VKADTDVFKSLDEVDTGKTLTSLEVFGKFFVGTSVDKDLAHLPQLFVEHDLLVFGEDVEDVADDDLVVLRSLAQHAHNAQEGVPFKVVSFIGV